MKSYQQYICEQQQTAKGNYVAVSCTTNATKLVSPEDGEVVDDSHITLMYSEHSNVDHETILSELNNKFKSILGDTIKANKVDYFENESGEDGTIVIRINNETLNEIHLMLTDLGMKHSYPSYNPHVSLVYHVSKEKYNSILARLEQQLEETPAEFTFTKFIAEDIK